MDKRKLLFVEISFFAFYFIILQLITDLQYISVYHNQKLSDIVVQRLTTIPLLALPYFFYYKFQLPLLFRKRYSLFFLSVLLFLICLEFYLPILDRWGAHNPFVAEKVKLGAKQMLKEPPSPRQMIGLTISYLLTLTGLGYFVMKMEDEIKLRKLKEQHLQLQLDHLKGQLQPHFFFNTLNNIYSLSLDSSAETATTVAKLADLMRYVLYDTTQEKAPLEKEVTFLRHYIDLEKIRHNGNCKIKFSVVGETKGIAIAPLLFVPLLENGFKHGINNTFDNGWLVAELRLENNHLHFEVKNTVSQASRDAQGGVGLANLRKRLQLLYPERHSFETIKNEHQFKAVLKLNLL